MGRVRTITASVIVAIGVIVALVVVVAQLDSDAADRYAKAPLAKIPRGGAVMKVGRAVATERLRALRRRQIDIYELYLNHQDPARVRLSVAYLLILDEDRRLLTWYRELDELPCDELELAAILLVEREQWSAFEGELASLLAKSECPWPRARLGRSMLTRESFTDQGKGMLEDLLRSSHAPGMMAAAGLYLTSPDDRYLEYLGAGLDAPEIAVRGAAMYHLMECEIGESRTRELYIEYLRSGPEGDLNPAIESMRSDLRTRNATRNP